MKWLKLLFIKLVVLSLAVVIAFGVYLDAQIKQKFEGHKWQLPIHVYGQAMDFAKGDALTRTGLIERLKLLDYSRNDHLTHSGQYALMANKDLLEFVRRGYETPDVQVAAKHLRVQFYQGRIKRIYDVKAKSQLSGFSLEPFLVDSIQANNFENRILVNLDEVPEFLTQSLILIEDRDFYDHHGVAPLSIVRALIQNIKAGRTVQGGSTLTQQLVKNMFLSHERSLWRKIKEAYIAVLLDAQYSKEEILQAYANEVYLGQHSKKSVNGFAMAARFYFAKQLSELEHHQQALLVALVKGASYYDPRRNPERATERRDLVLRLMTEHNYLSRKEYEYAVSRPLDVISKDKILSGRFPSYIAKVKTEFKKIVKEQAFSFDPHSGVKLFTHFDPLAQTRAQNAVARKLSQLESAKGSKQLQAGMVVINSQNGAILAQIGDRKANYKGFDRALYAKRNIGSLVKPAIYLTALNHQQNYHLATPLQDEPIALGSESGKRWQPKNYDGKYQGQVLLIDALSASRNVPTVNLGMELGIDKVTDTLRLLGVDSYIPQYPAMLLGSIEMTPMQVASMYQPIANMGYKRDLHALFAIKAQHKVIWRQNNEYSQKVINAEQAYLLNYALQETTRTGTAKWLSNMYSKSRFAGKTGTTNDSRDSWFVGYDQTELAVVWVGRDDNKPTKLTGSSGALKVYGEYQAKRKPINLVVPKPESIALRYFDKKQGTHLAPGCENVRLLPALYQALPKPTMCQRKPKKGEAFEKEPEKKKSWFERLFGG
ncbi:penicillin-binding protein 1B [Catenovulum sp. SM1970]|nr:penicillin-binding protein 1B [Marinifaba aquimaris]NTS78382.1 penicillin-binding protein 1B [Marinifaba aquimaris]